MNYDKFLCDKIKSINPSGIRRFFDLANSMDNVISLGVGEPSFNTNENIIRKTVDAMCEGKNLYTSNSGNLHLRTKICDYLESEFNVPYNPNNEIYVTVGASEAIDNAIRALINNGDEVIIPIPTYVSYKPLAILSGANVVTIKTKEEDKFRVTAEQIRNSITEKTKLLILSFPSNPTGAILDENDLKEIAKVVIENDILVLSDEIYGELTYGQKHTSIASIEGMRERTILVSGFSKAFSMTGFRVGYACGPKELIKEMLKIHQFSIMCAPTNSQVGAISALDNYKDIVDSAKNIYNERRLFLINELSKMGLKCFSPQGAFYIFPNISSTNLKAEEFCEKLLLSKRIAVVPGTAFGESYEDFIRISYSYSMEHIEIAISRIKEFINEIN